MIGKTILHYEILEKLGEGGMGVVYKAEDTKLKRDVAIKFLPSRISANEEERERFNIEAQAAAALNHPNIAHIYAIEETDDEMFIVMEYIDGQELKNIIKTEILNSKSAIDYAIQIAEGLQAAHKKDIVHRDIKSANIMITEDGKVKIMDFGLAKVRGGTLVTKAGTTLGTAAYMSPEQARGDEVDHRSDIWSFGVVLYEMLTGQLPFSGDYEAAVAYSILNENPKPINEERPEIPLELQNIVTNALQKNPEERYQQVQDLLTDLKNVGTGSTESKSTIIPKINLSQGKVKKLNFLYYGIGLVILVAILGYFLFSPKNSVGPETPSSEKKMIVVLPFENLGLSEDEYFADGLTEEITSKLSGLSGLGVIARQSAMQYKKTTKSVRQIGEELGVSYILQGTVRWENVDGNEHVRVTPQLIDVREGTQIWSQASEEILSSSFKLQSEIAGRVVQALDIKLALSEKQTLTTDITTNAEAYDYYLRGITYFEKSFNESDYKISEEMLLKAIELDPNFSRAYAALSSVHSSTYFEYFDHTESRVLKAKQTAEKSLQLGPDLIEGHIAMGWYYYLCWLDYSNALTEFRYALKLQPDNAEAVGGIGYIYRRQGRFQEALDYFRKALEISPRDYTLINGLAYTLILLRRYTESEQYVQKTIILAPDWRESYTSKAWLYLLWSGDIGTARSVFKQADEQDIRVETGTDIFCPIFVEIAGSNYEKALELIKNMKTDVCDYQFYYTPKDMFLAEINGLTNNKKLEIAYYDSARGMLQSKLKEFPNDARMHSSLGIAYAGLGEKDKAINEGKRGVELLPISKEAWNGYYRELDLAKIYTMVGEYDLAIDKIEYLLSIPGELSVPYIKIDPVWKPLFNNPRFQKVLEKYQ
jgi:serine/threonine protein kinase/Flp pilus assembly protein TadD